MAAKICISTRHGRHLQDSFGLSPDQEHDVVDPPEGYEDVYPESVWVFSEKRQEPVRLLPREFMWVSREEDADAED